MTFLTRHLKPLVPASGGASVNQGYGRWYFRDGTPADEPDYQNTDTYYGNFWGGSSGQALWTSPTPATVNGNARVLLNTPPNPNAVESSTAQSNSGAAGVDFSGISARFVGAPLNAQTIPAWAYRIGFSTWEPNGNCASFTYFQIHIYRPGSGIVTTWSESATEVNRSWGRYIPRTWIVFVSGTSLSAQLGDRFVVDVILNSDNNSPVIPVTSNAPWFLYGGGNDGFVNAAFKSGYVASYIDLPVLSYQTYTP
jgi:hypothetical protein